MYVLCACSMIYMSRVCVAVFTMSYALLKLLVSLSNGALGQLKVASASYAFYKRERTCTCLYAHVVLAYFARRFDSAF